MKIEQILKELLDDCWMFESELVQNEKKEFLYKVKFTCGVQARGRHESTKPTFTEALTDIYLKIKN